GESLNDTESYPGSSLKSDRLLCWAAAGAAVSSIGGGDMTEPVRWGVLGAAGIAFNRVIPAMQAVAVCDVRAIASREAGKARAAADRAGIEIAYGSYEELLADSAIEAVYIPLPNHLHVEWCAKAMEAGKHVLCEKPLALTADEAV